MEVPELVINLAGEEFTLSEYNSTVCLFTDFPAYDHLYVSAPVFAVFECRKLLDQLLHMGFPMHVHRVPGPWDLSAYDGFIAKQVGNIDFELDQLESELEGEGDGG